MARAYCFRVLHLVCIVILLFLLVVVLVFSPRKRRTLEHSYQMDSYVATNNNKSNILKELNCILPDGGFHSWRKSMVTKLKPEIKKNCQKLFEGDMSEVKRLEAEKLQWRNNLSDSELLRATANCSFVKDYFSNNLYVTKLERSFPIAFVFIIHNSPQQVLRLFRLLYRPHNQYCIHPDLKSSSDFLTIFRNIATCLDNVHIASELKEVYWGHKSIMESIMGCYKDLMRIRENQSEGSKWKYVINLCGKELPLKSNHEIITHLVKLNGTSMVEAHKVTPNDEESLSRLWKAQPIPYSVPYAKAFVYMALSPKFIHFLFADPISVRLYEYFKHCIIPEEHYFATVYLLPNVPGGFNPNLPKEYLFSIDRYYWIFKRTKNMQCHGNVVHYICVVEIGDLNWIVKSPGFDKALFQNKHFMESDHLVMDCMEERIVHQNQLEYNSDCYNPN